MAGFGSTEGIALGIFMLLIIIFAILIKRDLAKKKKDFENGFTKKKISN